MFACLFMPSEHAEQGLIHILAIKLGAKETSLGAGSELLPVAQDVSRQIVEGEESGRVQAGVEPEPLSAYEKPA